jgi:hypothetical protein
MDSMQEIYGLRYDFVYRQGLVMKLHRSAGIYAQELSGIQLRMLESNTIPRLLPLEVEEIDFQISLLYHMHSKRMLSKVLKAEGLTNTQFIKLMFAILCALDQSGNYMLNESQYLLKENFIFIGSEITDVYLTYLPFQQLIGEVPLHSQVGMLIGRLIEKVKPDEREGLDELLKACTEDFNLSSFKQKLLEWMGKPQINKVFQNQFEPPIVIPQIPLKHELIPFAPPMPRPLYQKDSEPEQKPFNEPLSEAGNHIDVNDNPFLLTQRNRLLILVVILLVLAFIWKSYLDNPHDANLYTASGASLLLIDAWILFSFIGLPRALRWHGLVNLKNNKPVTPQASEPKLQVNIHDYYQNLHNHTTLLTGAPSNATVFLGSTHSYGVTPLKARTTMIEVSKEGSKQQIPMIGNSFTIGRGEEECSYVEHEAGLSRLHAEIFKALEGYGVKDLGSKNGTLLNDEPLVPYQSYLIKEGDTIRILKTEFRIV